MRTHLAAIRAVEARRGAFVISPISASIEGAHACVPVVGRSAWRVRLALHVPLARDCLSLFEGDEVAVGCRRDMLEFALDGGELLT
jgi:hypothetical protein